MSDSSTRSITRATIAVAAIALGAKLLGFFEKQVLAYYFGAGSLVDAWFVAVSVPLFLFLLVRELIEPAFLPVFVKNLREGMPDRAWQLVTALAIAIAALVSVTAVLVLTGGAATVQWLAPGIDAVAVETASELLGWLVPAAVLLALSSLTYITLNGYRRFALPATGDLVFKVGPPLLGLMFVDRLGIAALALGFLLGATGRVLVHLFGLRREVRHAGMLTPGSRADLQILGLLMLPLVLGATTSQISELADNFFASQIGEGGVAARSYAKKIRDLPLEIVPYTLSIVLFPHFAFLAAAGSMARLRAILGASVHGIAILFAALGVVFWFLAEPIVSVALERGAFDDEARRAVAWPLQCYALGMVTFAVEMILVNVFFAVRDTLTPILVGVVGVALNIALCAVLIEPMGVGGVALALTISKSVKLMILVCLLGRRGLTVDWARVLCAVMRLGLAAMAAALALSPWVSESWGEIDDMGTSQRSLVLVHGGLLGMAVFFVTLLAVGRRERRLVCGAISMVASSFFARARGTSSD